MQTLIELIWSVNQLEILSAGLMSRFSGSSHLSIRLVSYGLSFWSRYYDNCTYWAFRGAILI